MLTTLSVIVPSYNQAPYIEETLLSILNQNYPRLELMVIDGGSTDGSVEIIKKYADRIAYWVSEPDHGQSHAINKGLEKATGEWVAWMNSDDCYLPGAFNHIFKSLPHTQYDFIYGNTCCGRDMGHTQPFEFKEADKNSLYQILKFFYGVQHIIPSQSVFVRRSVLEKAGFLNETMLYCMDLDWYCRIFLATDKRYFYPETLSFFRMHESSKSGGGNNSGWEESISIAYQYITCLTPAEQKSLQSHINYAKWAHKARLEKTGIFTLLRVAYNYGSIALNHPGYRIILRNLLDAWFGKTRVSNG